MRVLPILASAALLACAISACRSRQLGDRPDRPAAPAARGSQYLIEGDELANSPGENLYEVVRLKRPTWLERTVRNMSGDDAVAVYLDERLIGSLSILRQLPVRVAVRMQYLQPTEAQIRYGPQHGSRAAIQVDSRK